MVPSRLELHRSRVKEARLVRDDYRQAGIPPRQMGSGRLLLCDTGPIGRRGSRSVDLKS